MPGRFAESAVALSIGRAARDGTRRSCRRSWRTLCFVAVSLNARILVVSDTVASGHGDDRSGPGLEASLGASGFVVDLRRVVPDGVESVASALREMCDGFCGLLVTTGGTGFSPRDLTPEATRTVIDREAPGLAEAMRLVNPLGRLSRAIAGTRGLTIILNLPGSPRGALECLGAVIDVVPHALELLGGANPHRPTLD